MVWIGPEAKNFLALVLALRLALSKMRVKGIAGWLGYPLKFGRKKSFLAWGDEVLPSLSYI